MTCQAFKEIYDRVRYFSLKAIRAYVDFKGRVLARLAVHIDETVVLLDDATHGGQHLASSDENGEFLGSG